MTVSDDLPREAARRWEALATAEPELGPAIEVQRRLLAEQIALLSRLERDEQIAPPAETARLVDKLRHGEPALRGENVELPVAALAPSLGRFCDHLAEGGTGDVARHVIEAFESGRLSRTSLLRASLARDRRTIQSGATQLGVSPDLVWLVGELATAPLAHVLRCRLLERPAGEAGRLAKALAAWSSGYCGVCGSWPALIEQCDGQRTLRCSFCSAAWHTTSRACLYCGEEGRAFATFAPDPERPRHVLDLCDRCGGYTKVIPVSTRTPFPLVAIDDLATLALDRAAAARGYGRPPLRAPYGNGARTACE